jgi:hypothetical protein
MNDNKPATTQVDLSPVTQLSRNTGVALHKGPAKNMGILSRAVNDRYRCPDQFFDFGLSGPLSTAAGYFRFSPHAICYGNTASGRRSPRPDSQLWDAISEVRVEDTKLVLPFDPNEIIENLRLERYAPARNSGSKFQKFFRQMYYHARPFLNLAVRKQVQKFHARHWEEKMFPKWPVDTSVEEICETLLLRSMQARGVEQVPFVWYWPQGANGCLMMTHDVETSAGRDYCTKLMNVDDSFGLKAAIGIVPQERYEVPADFLESIRGRGFEIAVQDLNHDGRLFDNKQEFLRRARLINRYGREYGARGFRAGVLYRKPEWYDALEFAYDMSIPNVAHLDPQHGGCCTVMPYFIGELLELPVTTIQDYTLMHVLNERSIDLWKSQIDLILRKNGLLSFIAHPDYLMEPGTLSVYESLLDYLRELREKTPLWCALPREIDAWWRARSKMSVVRDGASWRIEGDDSGRAVLAFAKNVDGKLRYELPGATRPGKMFGGAPPVGLPLAQAKH